MTHTHFDMTELVPLDGPVSIIDVGAHPIDGPPPWQSLLANGHARVTGFEPQQSGLSVLQEQAGPSERYFPTVLGSGGPATLHICQAPGMTSTLEPNPAILSHFNHMMEWAKVIERRPVVTERLDDMTDIGAIDLVKLDVQGGELEVILGGMQRLSQALVIHIEMSFVPLYIDQPGFGDVDAVLQELGFRFHAFHQLQIRSFAPLEIDPSNLMGMHQSFECDAVYVRDFTAMNRLSSGQLRRLAFLLHTVYFATGFAHLALAEHDRRYETDWAPAYLARIGATD